MGMGIYQDLEKCAGFQWDEGNSEKNWEKHRVSDGECEEIFFNDPLVAGADRAHSRKEQRFFVLGQTDAGRHLFVVFTIRNHLIRVISTRDMTRKELRKYKT